MNAQTAGTLQRSAMEAMRFDGFVLQPARRMLLDGEQVVRIGSRALELLILLVENAGQVVSNDDIVQRVWPTTVVVEGNLRVHIAGLRKALGDGREGRRYIVNSPGKGYSFVAPVERAEPAVPSSPVVMPVAAGRLPALLNRVIGQQATIASVGALLASQRLVTLIGTGGIGKTSVALTVAEALAGQGAERDGVHFVDLASVSRADLVASAVAAALGLASVAQDPAPSLIAFLKERALLIVLDNCEHVVTAVAALVEQLLRGAPRVRILATSREPLRAQGEWVHRLAPLRLPPASAGLSVEQALGFAGVELFVERLSAARDGFCLTEADVGVVVALCRRLDGLPLAIELAAARAGAIGLRPVASALNDSVSLLGKGRRTANDRHQTLQATLDWSFRLLSASEQRVLMRLSVFTGAFTLASARAVGAAIDSEEDMAPTELVAAVLELVDKSLLSADVSGDDAFFRLLETTRAYALERLQTSKDAQPVRRRHAAHCLDLLIEAQDAWRSAPLERWLDNYGRRIDDVRAALSWSFSEHGDRALGIALTAKSALLFFQLSLADEFRRHAEQAMPQVQATDGLDPRWLFELNVVYGHMLYHTVGLPPERERALQRSRRLAEEIGDTRLQALASSTNWMAAYQTAEPQRMLEHALRYEALTAEETDASWTHMRDRMKAPAYHLLGNQVAARVCCERGLAIAGIVRPPFVSGSQINLRVSMGTVLARVLWVQGLPDSAEEVTRRTIEAALQDGESVALAFLLGFAACPLALWTGDLALARERVTLLRDHTRKHALNSWRNYAIAFESLLDVHNQAAEPTWPELAIKGAATPPLIELLATLHPRLLCELAVQRAEAGLSGWCRAEVARAQGMQLLEGQCDGAEAKFLQALDWARLDGAPAWELRAATSLARVWLDRGRAGDALELLAPLLERMSEGLQTQDRLSAKATQRAALAVMGAPHRPSTQTAAPGTRAASRRSR
jgi:predicted ATPase/DNA-binding winged helix-turn-helix (wHTH) protein